MSRFEKSEWLKLAQDVLKSDGPAALTLERLTTAAGKTRGSFYHHFNSRDEFLRALMLDWQAASLTSLSTGFRPQKPKRPDCRFCATSPLNGTARLNGRYAISQRRSRWWRSIWQRSMNTASKVWRA